MRNRGDIVMVRYSTGPFSNEMKKSIPAWVKQGMSIEKIAARIKRTPEGIVKFLEENGFTDEDIPDIPIVIKYQTGRFSKEMKRSIPAWIKQGVTIEEIATRINRSPEGIRKFMDDIGLIDKSMPVLDSDAHSISVALKNKPYWKNLQEQFDDNELQFFEHMWIKMMMEQFRQDLLPAEELQVKQLLTLDIFMNRSAKDRQQQIKEISRTQKDLDQEYKKPKGKRDMARIDYLESRLSYARSAVSNHTTEHTKLLDKMEKIQKDLKATRDQRVKRIEDAKTSFTGLIRALEDEQFRNRMGQEAELMNVAKNNAMEELSDWHEYGKDTDYAEVDVPILNAETVMKHDDI